MAKQRNKMAEEPKSGPHSSHSSTPNHAVTSQQIAALAYTLWRARGCPEGSPDIDWLQAEQELLEKVPVTKPEPNKRRSAVR